MNKITNMTTNTTELARPIRHTLQRLVFRRFTRAGIVLFIEKDRSIVALTEQSVKYVALKLPLGID